MGADTPKGALRPSPISSTVDLSANGKQHGHLNLPYSRDDSAWGAIMIPITVIANGEGPTALLTGANHGDEYEGPVALFDLARRLQPEEINGRVILVPAMNFPAFKAATRTSPIDRGNMNRAFPGAPDGSVTEKIADYFQRHLLPLADAVLDIHAGGKTLDFLPFAAAHILPDARQQTACEAAMKAFGAPYHMLLKELDSVGMYDTAAEELGKIFVSTELGGGGSSTAKSNAIAKRGVDNFLRHLSILKDGPQQEVQNSTRLHMPDEGSFIQSRSAGLVEFLCDLGDFVEEGQTVVLVHPIDQTGLPPTAYKAEISGLLTGRHFPGLTQPGDSLALIAQPQN
ncbi:N(2)-acetyl-L-2,4-diaminobutanoate deacetylase DoeB [Rhodovibrionaceae bacterium A322]